MKLYQIAVFGACLATLALSLNASRRCSDAACGECATAARAPDSSTPQERTQGTDVGRIDPGTERERPPSNSCFECDADPLERPCESDVCMINEQGLWLGP